MQDIQTGRRLPVPSRADRQIAKSSKGHCTGHTVLGDGPGRRMQAESHLELTHLLLLNADPGIVDLREQVLFRFGPRDASRHFFDVVATRRCGTRIAYTVKPEVWLRSGRFLEEMGEVAWWVREKRFADDVRLLTDADVDPVALHNAKVIAAVRAPDPEADAAAGRAADALVGGASLLDLTAMTGLEERGYRAVLRLVRSGRLAPARRERISPATVLLPARAA